MVKKLNMSGGEKKVISNVIWNMIASFLATAVLQLCVHPLLAKFYDEVSYGNILFIVGILNVIILTVGNALGDIRLTEDGGYKRDGLIGDFNLLLIIGCAISAIAMAVIVLLYRDVVSSSLISVLITLPIVCILGVLHSYLSALFRLNLLFKQSLVLSIFSALGYLVGIGLTYLTAIWTLPFLFSHLFSVLYQLKITGFYKEPLKWTPRRKKTAKKYRTLSFSYLLKSCMTYVDRFVIVPLLGADTLSVFTVASVFGKTTSVAVQPVANVALGYYAQKDFVMTRKKYWVTNVITLSFGAVMYLIALLFSKLFITILYPTYVEEAVKYIALANVAAIMTAVSAMIQPAVLKYANMAWQIIIQIIYGVLIIIASLILIPQWHLIGFCWASIIAGACKIVIMLLVGDRGIRAKV